jgi:hypothetical protein
LAALGGQHAVDAEPAAVWERCTGVPRILR